MKKSKFEIGKIYTDSSKTIQLQFVGKNEYGSKIFKPLNGIVGGYIPYNEYDELEDPACKKGYVGFQTGNGLKEV